MPDPKLIHKERFNVEETQKARISYNDIFKIEDEEDVDYSEVIERNNLEWSRRLNEAKQEAVREGYEAGVQDGKEKAKAVIEDQLHHFERALMDLDQRLQHVVDDLKPGVTSLIFDLAEKVIEVPVRTEELEAKVLEQVESALEQISSKRDIKITVAEEDYEAIHTLLEKLNFGGQVDIRYDETLNAGEFRIDTPHQAVINSFRKKLEDIRANLSVKDWGRASQ